MLGHVVRVASGSNTAARPACIATRGALGAARPQRAARPQSAPAASGPSRGLASGPGAPTNTTCKRCYTSTAPRPAFQAQSQLQLQMSVAPSGAATAIQHATGAAGATAKAKLPKLEWRQYSSMSSSSSGSKQHIPVIRSLSQLRRWRRQAREEGKEVGVVPTMGALHQGHLDLASLQRHPLTVMTLFVNPMQFAPTEDLAAYPRTLDRDLDLLRTLLPPASSSSFRGLGVSESDGSRPDSLTPVAAGMDGVRGLGVSENDRAPASISPSGAEGSLQAGELGSLVVFAPAPDVMYPLKGDLQDLRAKRGVEVDVKGWGDVMEGASRPQFFKGVATVCTKLFNAVEPDHAYFGQKDIQQALLLKIMLQDLLLAHPLPENMHILPTTRAADGLALSSRNAYLSPAEREVAPTLYKALDAARASYRAATATPTSASSASSAAASPCTMAEDLITTATAIILAESQRLLDLPSTDSQKAEIKLDYVEVFDKHTFEPVRGEVQLGREVVIAAAMWVGGTRLIDNLLLGWGEGWEV